MTVILCGKSSAGKDKLQSIMEDKECFRSLVSTTSRPMRDGEVNGIQYNFTTREGFEKLIETDMLIEYRTYNVVNNGDADVWYYGLPKQNLLENENYVVVLDFQGAEEFTKYYGRENCYIVYIDVDDVTRTERAKKRGSFEQAEWNRRMIADEKDFPQEKIESLCDLVVENYGKPEKTVDLILRRFMKHMNRR